MEYDLDFDEMPDAPFRAVRVPRRFLPPSSSLRHELFTEEQSDSDQYKHVPCSSPEAGPSSSPVHYAPPPPPIEDERREEAHWIARVYGSKPCEAIVKEYERRQDPWVGKRHEARLRAWGHSLVKMIEVMYRAPILSRWLDQANFDADCDRFLEAAMLIESLRTERITEIEAKSAKLHSRLLLPITARPSSHVSHNPLSSSRLLLPRHAYPEPTPKEWHTFMAVFEYDYVTYIDTYGMPNSKQMVVDLSLPEEAENSLMTVCLRMTRQEVSTLWVPGDELEVVASSADRAAAGDEEEATLKDYRETVRDRDLDDEEARTEYEPYIDRDLITPPASHTPSSTTSDMDTLSDDDCFTLSSLRPRLPSFYVFDAPMVGELEDDAENDYIPLGPRSLDTDKELEFQDEAAIEEIASCHGAALDWPYRKITRGSSSPDIVDVRVEKGVMSMMD